MHRNPIPIRFRPALAIQRPKDSNPSPSLTFPNRVSRIASIGCLGLCAHLAASGSLPAAEYAIPLAPLATSEIKKVTASDAAAGDQFGRAVAMSADLLVVGAPQAGATPR